MPLCAARLSVGAVNDLYWSKAALTSDYNRPKFGGELEPTNVDTGQSKCQSEDVNLEA